MTRAFIIAAFGDRRIQIQRLVKNIRSYVDYSIYIVTTIDSDLPFLTNYSNIHIEYVERIWPKGTSREGVRNSNFYKVSYALKLPYISFCLLDDDMFIVNKNFIDGFNIAERFGAALPLNPRVYVKYNAMGADVQRKDLEDIKDLPQYAPACNFSPFFVCPRVTDANVFLRTLKSQLHFNTCRGTLAIWKASWQTGFSPVYLPEQWCVCGENARYIKEFYSVQLKGQHIQIEPIMLHLGHEKVRKIYGLE